MISRNCSDNEHSHCGGQLKFANADNTDDCYPCECDCHTHMDRIMDGIANAAKDAGTARQQVLKELYDIADRCRQCFKDGEFQRAEALMFILAKFGVNLSKLNLIASTKKG